MSAREQSGLLTRGDASSSFAVSVVIPSHNCASYLPEAIDSARAQSLPPIEIIVVDDGSTDNSAQVLAECARDSRVRCLTKPRGGPGSARNTGIRVAKGEWIALLDADDVWMPDHLERVAGIFQKVPRLRWAGGAYVHERLDGTTRNQRLSPEGETLLLEGCWFSNYFEVTERLAVFQTSSILLHRTCIAEVGYFDETKMFGEDRDLFARIAVRYPEVGYCTKVTSRYRGRVGSISESVGRTRPIDVIRWVHGLQNGHPEAARRVMPFARYLAVKGMKSWLHQADRESLCSVVKEAPASLPRSYLLLARALCALPPPVMGTLARLLRSRSAVLRAARRRGTPRAGGDR